MWRMMIGKIAAVCTLALAAPAGRPPPIDQPSPSSESQESPPAPAPDWGALTMDALIEALPRVGAEWNWDQVDRKGVEHPASVEMARRLLEGAELTDEQWRRVLHQTGAIIVRTRWPAPEPFAISMEVPRWLGIAQIRARARGGRLLPARAGELMWSSSGTFPAIRAAEAKYQRLGTLEPGRQEVVFDVVVERGTGGPFRKAPPPGLLWEGELRYEVEVVETLDGAIPPISDAALDEAVRHAVGAGFRWWHSDGEQVLTAFVVMDPDVARHPVLAHTGLSLAVDVLRDGQEMESGPLAAARNDSLALVNSVSGASLKFYGSRNLRTIPAEVRKDPEELARWSLRVRGTGEYAIYLWEAQQRWGGELTIPLAEALHRERERVGPEGRGPEISTPRRR